MVLYLLYIALFSILILKNRFFGVFRHHAVSARFVLLLFIGKALAVPVFYEVYERLYGGIANFDTGKFFHDAEVIRRSAWQHPGNFLRIMTGIQDDAAGSEDHELVLKYTLNWDNGTVKDFLYNDNRIVTRVHVITGFLAPGSWPAQSLFSCAFSFIGIFLMFRSAARFCPGREKPVLLVLCFFPALWFYTGAMLKEGLCLLVMGLTVLCCEKIFGEKHWRYLLLLLICILISLLLKPYLLFVFVLLCLLYFTLEKFPAGAWKFVTLVLALLCTWLLAETVSRQFRHRGLAEAALEHQRRFEAVSRGGLFLSDSLDYVQLAPDSSLVKHSSDRPGMYQIRYGSAYMYWKAEKPRDTLYCRFNTDTLKNYGFIYFIAPSRSNIQLSHEGAGAMVAEAFYYSLLYPFFVNAAGPLQWLASVENLILLMTLLVVLLHMVRYRSHVLLPLLLILFSAWILLLVGVSAPNSGAIFRYRAPAVVLLAAYAAAVFSQAVKSRRAIQPAY